MSCHGAGFQNRDGLKVLEVQEMLSSGIRCGVAIWWGLFVSGDPPCVSHRVLDTTHSITVNLVPRLLHWCRTVEIQSTLVCCVHIRDVDMEPRRWWWMLLGRIRHHDSGSTQTEGWVLHEHTVVTELPVDDRCAQHLGHEIYHPLCSLGLDVARHRRESVSLPWCWCAWIRHVLRQRIQSPILKGMVTAT